MTQRKKTKTKENAVAAPRLLRRLGLAQDRFPAGEKEGLVPVRAQGVVDGAGLARLATGKPPMRALAGGCGTQCRCHVPRPVAACSRSSEYRVHGQHRPPSSAASGPGDGTAGAQRWTPQALLEEVDGWKLWAGCSTLLY